jgi:hypothetical protein
MAKVRCGRCTGEERGYTLWEDAVQALEAWIVCEGRRSDVA